MSINWLLIVAGAILVLLEVVLGAVSGFDFLLLGTAILAGGILGVFLHSTPVGIATAGVLALAYVALGRKHIRNRLQRRGVPTNTDALLGRTARVTETIGPDRPGRIKLEGDEWRASLATGSATLTPGVDARVVRIDGVTLFVEPVEGITGGKS